MSRGKPDKKLRVLELYSGIGGMHFALEESGIPHEVIAAVDINTVANDIYKHNFPKACLINRCIESISVQEFNQLSPDMVLMSPPCQPFVRVGKQRDVQDERTKSFLHLLQVISSLEKPVSYILLENVKGFDGSEAHRRLLETLTDAQYLIQEFLVSPLQCGVPNSRLRYYLLAKRQPQQFHFPVNSQIWTDFPDCAQQLLVHKVQPRDTGEELAEKSPQGPCPIHSQADMDSVEDASVPGNEECSTERHNTHSTNTSSSRTENNALSQQDSIVNSNSDCHKASVTENSPSHSLLASDDKDLPLYERCAASCRKLSEYLEEGGEDYLVPEKFFRRFWVMDIVKPTATNSCCFTKRYGHHIEGAGSVVQMNTESMVDLWQYKKERVYTEEAHEAVRDLRLRFFSPREIANLMHFPKHFWFPEVITTIQGYRVLGNSLNVHVVAVLLQLLTLGDGLTA